MKIWTYLLYVPSLLLLNEIDCKSIRRKSSSANYLDAFELENNKDFLEINLDKEMEQLQFKSKSPIFKNSLNQDPDIVLNSYGTAKFHNNKRELKNGKQFNMINQDPDQIMNKRHLKSEKSSNELSSFNSNDPDQVLKSH